MKKNVGTFILESTLVRDRRMKRTSGTKEAFFVVYDDEDGF